MKKTLLILFLAQVVLACSDSKTTEQSTMQEDSLTVSSTSNEQDGLMDSEGQWDISALPISTKDLGEFPFFTAPKGAKYINNVKVKDFDFIVFVTPESIFEVEGKTFRAYVHEDRDSDTEISGRYLNKSYEEAILSAGGVKVFEGKLTEEQTEKYKELATYAGQDGSLDVWNDTIAMYVIRRNDGDIYIALSKATINAMSIQIVQEEPFEQTIEKVSADKIEKDLLEQGKSVLHINFDTDKATLKSEGTQAVQEILKVLQKNTDLKIAINGYTDNSGTASHNLQLSDERAQSVKKELMKAGINENRLTAKGFGQENPVASNDSEEGKAENRRVELIRL